MFLNTFNSEFSYIEVWFADQNSNPLDLEDKTSITLVVLKYNKWHALRAQRLDAIQFHQEIEYGFLSFARNMDKNFGKNISKKLNSKYSQKRLDRAKQSVTDALKTAQNKAIQKKKQKQLVI